MIERKARRSVEKDYDFYDPPERVWEKINERSWEYKTRIDYYEARDVALMSLLYLTCARVSEVVRSTLRTNRPIEDQLKKPSLTRDQFVMGENFLNVRQVPIIKVKTVKKGNTWSEVKVMSDYPFRREIRLPLNGGLSVFTKTIITHLNTLSPREELFKFGRVRAWTIVNHITGEMNHYFRDMGLKLYVRLFNRNLASLKRFSGHRRVDNLMRYLGEGEIDDELLSYKEF